MASIEIPQSLLVLNFGLGAGGFGFATVTETSAIFLCVHTVNYSD
jgi:hypothetical protein